jgi:hypothetical protein
MGNTLFSITWMRLLDGSHALLTHWEDVTGTRAERCANYMCCEKRHERLMGVFAMMDNEDAYICGIIPICELCISHKKGDYVFVRDHTHVVPMPLAL